MSALGMILSQSLPRTKLQYDRQWVNVSFRDLYLEQNCSMTGNRSMLALGMILSQSLPRTKLQCDRQPVNDSLRDDLVPVFI